MMLSVLVWLAMQGQVQQRYVYHGPDGTDIDQTEIVNDACSHYFECLKVDGRYVTDSPEPKPKPAEHVIEIKTVREHRTKRPAHTVTTEVCLKRFIDGGMQSWRPADFGGNCPYDSERIKTVEPADCDKTEHLLVERNKRYCVTDHSTRELWIDGRRWGVVKELD